MNRKTRRKMKNTGQVIDNFMDSCKYEANNETQDYIYFYRMSKLYQFMEKVFNNETNVKWDNSYDEIEVSKKVSFHLSVINRLSCLDSDKILKEQENLKKYCYFTNTKFLEDDKEEKNEKLDNLVRDIILEMEKEKNLLFLIKN